MERRLGMSEPETGGLFGHDEWYLTPKFNIRTHHEWRNCLHVPDETDSAASSKELLGNERHTLVVFLDGRLQWIHDHWADPEAAATGHSEVRRSFVGSRSNSWKRATRTFPRCRLNGQRDWPTADAKSKQNQGRAISVRQPVIQVDYAFVGHSTK